LPAAPTPLAAPPPGGKSGKLLAGHVLTLASFTVIANNTFVPSHIGGAPAKLNASQFSFTISATPGSRLRVLTSIDLVNGAEVGRITNASGTAIFMDYSATNGRQFYRLQSC
jgi:hypothetical protein